MFINKYDSIVGFQSNIQTVIVKMFTLLNRLDIKLMIFISTLVFKITIQLYYLTQTDTLVESVLEFAKYSNLYKQLERVKLKGDFKVGNTLT